MFSRTRHLQAFGKSPKCGTKKQVKIHPAHVSINPFQLVSKISTAKIHVGTETFLIICTPKSIPTHTLISAESGHAALVQKLQNQQKLCINLAGTKTPLLNPGVQMTREISAANLRDTMQDLGAKLQAAMPGRVFRTAPRKT